mgnify:CR=1 FL=1
MGIPSSICRSKARIRSRTAKAADGSMRDALSLLDQCIAFYLNQDLTYQKRIEGPDREHMHLIDDIDLVFSLRGRIGHLFPDLTDIVPLREMYSLPFNNGRHFHECDRD